MLDESIYLKHDSWKSYLGKLSIMKTAALTKKCQIVLGGDTGVMHIAAAVGTATVSLFSWTIFF